MGRSPFRCSASCRIEDTGITSGPRARVASAAFSAGTNRVRIPASLAARAMGSTPETGRRFPSRLSSPRKAWSRSGAFTSWDAARSPKRMGKSYKVPVFFMPAGARFTVIRLTGNRNPLLFAAARTRSLDSFTAASGNPTISNAGSPLEMKHSAVT